MNSWSAPNGSKRVHGDNTVICKGVCVTYRRVLDWTIGFIQLGTKVIQRYRWYTRFTVHRYTHTRVLSLHQSYPGNGFQHSSYTCLTETAAYMKSSLRSLIPFLPFLLNHLRLSSLSVLILCCNCHLFSIIFAESNSRLPAHLTPELKLISWQAGVSKFN
jgi:hypothetical protein